MAEHAKLMRAAPAGPTAAPAHRPSGGLRHAALEQRPAARIERDHRSLLAGRSPIVQLSKGSSQANKELVKGMGKAASRVDKLPDAKPHTKKGTGSSGTDHQGRNAMVINKAKQDTMHAHKDPTMFSSSRMRTDDNSKEKDKAASEKRKEKKAASKEEKDERIREYWGLAEGEEITEDHRKHDVETWSD